MCIQPIFGNHRAPLLLETYETCINSFQIQSKVVRLITDSCSSNISAFSGLIIPDFECQFQNEDNELHFDSNSDGEESDDENITNENKVLVDIQDVLQTFFHSIETSNQSFRLPCYAHTLQLIVNDGLKGVQNKRNKRFYDLYKDPIFLLAPFLDGRFRLQWISTSTVAEEVQEELSNKIQQLVLEQCFVLDHVNEQPVTSNNDNSIPGTPKRKRLFTNMVNKNVKTAKSDPFGYIKDEIRKYLNEDDMGAMFLIKSSKNYPSLSKLALKVLSTPATSAPVEKVFSQSGFLFRQHRASMTRTTLQQTTMLKRNRDLL
ncbi:unnamed protein product [Didymodactylos carnosus]|uniref:HAT C-terminal dimerisation domain-containing protein n=1 Tax=Didymodactylos carnosus TaxID=1234261 RepID=A0A814W7C8_9BILA|nr:unnamed protein product [Didymodactylos carnosus]CAF3961806.1 unnamed protein product [Didymodactylos carnosus]